MSIPCKIMPLGLGYDLPEDYEPLDWIGFTGTQFIDTGLVYIDDDSFGEVQLVDLQNGSRIFQGSNIAISIWAANPYHFWSLLTTEEAKYNCDDTTILADPPFVLKLTKESIIVDGLAYARAYTTGAAAAGSYSIKIGAFSDGMGYTGSWLKGRVARAKFHTLDGDADFVPCRHKDTGEVGMYDLIRRAFYTNSGREDFETP